MGIVHRTLDTGVGFATSCRACRSSVCLRSSSRHLAMNRTAPCSTIALHNWSIHAARNQPSSGIPNAFRSSLRHSHQKITFRPHPPFSTSRATGASVTYDCPFGGCDPLAANVAHEPLSRYIRNQFSQGLTGTKGCGPSGSSCGSRCIVVVEAVMRAQEPYPS